MRESQRSIRFVLLVFLVAIAPRLRAQDFYTDRLAAGKAAVQARRFEDAVNEFRIACFGFLDQPVLLSQGLARLALAESEAKQSDDVRETVARFLEIERRFPSYAKAALEPEIRSAFDALLATTTPAATLSSIPSLAGVGQAPVPEPKPPPSVEKEPTPVEREKPQPSVEKEPTPPTPAEREKALQAQFQREPQNAALPLELARLAAARRKGRDVVKWAGRALELSPGNADALALRGHELAARLDYEKARADLAALPADRLESDPGLLADLFVCDASLKDWDAAQSLQPRLAEKSLDRKDVIRAKNQLTKQMARAQKEVAAPPPSAAPPPTQDAPPAAPAPPPNPPVPELLEIRQLILAGKPAEAEKQLLALARSDPNRREIRLALLEAACLVKDWKTAMAQLPSLSPFREGEEPSMFYAAVALYETGDASRAKTFLQRALPHIASSPYTQFYAKKILGP